LSNLLPKVLLLPIWQKKDKGRQIMIQITAFGLLAENAGASVEFYRDVLALERVMQLSDYESMTLLRIESPRVEIEQTCIEIHDRPNRQYSSERQRLRLICDLASTTAALDRAGIEISSDSHEFIDINGINWQLSDQQKRCLQTS
jgi:hypothetical protein